MSSKFLSTGVLRRHSDTQFLTVEAVNLDPEDARSVSVLMFDWSSGSPNKYLREYEILQKTYKQRSSSRSRCFK